MSIHFFRRTKRSTILTITISAVMAAIVAVATYMIQIPVPQTGGYLNVGDAMVFVSALIYGPVVGAFAGGIGSAIADLASPYAYFAPITFLVKGLEGGITGLLSDGKNILRDLLAVGVGSIVMVLGYFLAEAFIMGIGVEASLVEVPGNLFQVAFGGIVGIPLSKVVRRYLPSQIR